MTSALICSQYQNIPISGVSRYWGELHDIGADILPAAPAGRTGHCPGAPTGPASWSSARLDSLYTTEVVLTPFPAVLHMRLREMWSSTARREAKKVVPMRSSPASWQLQQINCLKVTGSDMAVNSSRSLETGSRMHWQSKRMAEATRATRSLIH